MPNQTWNPDWDKNRPKTANVRLTVKDREWLERCRAELGWGFSALISHAITLVREQHEVQFMEHCQQVQSAREQNASVQSEMQPQQIKQTS